MKTIAISIDEETLEGIDGVARSGQRRKPGRRGANRSEVVREALSEYLLRHERRKREARDRQAIAGHSRTLRREAAALVREQAEP